MRYLLDTNTWIHYLKRAGSLVEARLRRTPANHVAVCSIVWAELYWPSSESNAHTSSSRQC